MKRHFNTPLLVVSALLLCLVSLFLLKKVESRSQRDVGNALQSVLHSTEQSLLSWVKAEKVHLEIWAAQPQVIELAEELLATDSSPQALVQATAQAKLRTAMQPLLKAKYKGYFIIGPDNLSLASSRDSNIGTQNLLTEQPDRLDRVWAGDSMFFLPQTSDVYLGNNTRNVSIFVGTPIRNASGSTIAVLTFRLDPDQDFIPILNRGTIGETGSTIAYDASGQEIRYSQFGLPEGLLDQIQRRQDTASHGTHAMAPLAMLPQLSVFRAMSTQTSQTLAGERLVSQNGDLSTGEIGVWTWNDQLGFGLATRQSAAEAYATYRNVRSVWLALTLTALGLMGTVSLVRTRGARQNEHTQGHLQAVVDSAPDGIISLNSGGVIQSWNPGAARIFDYTADDVVGQPIRLLCPEWDFPQFQAERNSQGEFPRRELEGLKKDGTRFPLQLCISQMSVPGQRQYVATLRDITQRKRFEWEITHARDVAEAANRAKSVFLANISHEFRTPMNSILGFTQVTLDDPSLPPNQRVQLRMVQESGQHLLELIDDILEMSKFEAGFSPCESTPFQLQELLDEMMAEVRGQAEDKGLQTGITVGPDVQQSLAADVTKLKKVLRHLLDNALKFTDKGRIDLRVIPVLPDEARRMRIRFEVKDTGVGVPQAARERVFEAFEQASDRLSEGSTGLGLTICRNYVQAMGGKLQLESMEGQGSTFSFTIPAEPVKVQNDAPTVRSQGVPTSLADEDRGTRVLVVDDLPANRLLLVTLLRPLGFDIQEACNGMEALEAFQSFAPQVILMDSRMPGMDGLEATRRIKATEEGSHTPVIGISANSFPEDTKQALAAGSSEFLSKPYGALDLLEAMRRHTGVHYQYDGSRNAPRSGTALSS